MLELPKLFPESAFPTDVESQAICTIFFFLSFSSLEFKKKFSNFKKSLLSLLCRFFPNLSHSLSLPPFGLSQKLALSLSPSPSQNQKPQETLPSPTLPPSFTLSLTLATVDLRRLPSLTPAQGFRPPAKNGRPCSPSLAPVSFSLRRKKSPATGEGLPMRSVNRLPQIENWIFLSFFLFCKSFMGI
jgi:hypothetical protein